MFQEQPKSLPLLVALLRGARRDTLMRELSSYAPEWSGLRWGLRFSLAYELLRELRSVYFRIAEMHRIGADERGWAMKWLRGFPESLRDVMFQAHSDGIRNLRIQRPWLPAASYLRPTMKPVMFCRKTSGMPRCPHSSMKCAAFSADSLNRMPLLATMPTG